jgi:2-polyprenyl-3-methyl-5-hydroxy-6-metoxy-1,4-benzoquinol methylase
MENKRLKVIETNHIDQANSKEAPAISSSKMQRKALQARLDRFWLVDSEHMNPLRNCMERERIERTVSLLKQMVLEGKSAVDLGCGSGVMTRRVSERGASVDAVDISANALKLLKEKPMDRIQAIHEYVPMTTLKDDAYDLVISTELIAWLPADEYRLYFSELARLVKPEGSVVCSTLIDINSEDALQRFAYLAETEFNIEKWILSHHLCYLHIADFFKAPARFARSKNDSEYRQREIERRFGFSRWWFRINSAKAPGLLWSLVQYPLKPIVGLLRQSRTLLILLEKICAFFWPDTGVSHAIFIGKRRSMLETLPANELPKESKHKKQVWE